MSDTGPDVRRLEHFAQANPRGAGQGDVPALLRRVADSIDALGTIEVVDAVLHDEINEDGDWYSMTVYFRRTGWSGPESVITPVTSAQGRTR